MQLHSQMRFKRFPVLEAKTTAGITMQNFSMVALPKLPGRDRDNQPTFRH